MIQTIDHGIDHRSQISTLLTQQGIEPHNLDAWSYNDDVNA
ncbi:DinB family protein [Ktedonospora formicarum]|nr:DinB family protein [Ktedonospora formicarum]